MPQKTQAQLRVSINVQEKFSLLWYESFAQAGAVILMKLNLYLSILIESKPIVLDSSVVFTEDSAYLSLSLTRFLHNKRRQVFF